MFCLCLANEKRKSQSASDMRNTHVMIITHERYPASFKSTFVVMETFQSITVLVRLLTALCACLYGSEPVSDLQCAAAFARKSTMGTWRKLLKWAFYGSERWCSEAGSRTLGRRLSASRPAFSFPIGQISTNGADWQHPLKNKHFTWSVCRCGSRRPLSCHPRLKGTQVGRL